MTDGWIMEHAPEEFIHDYTSTACLHGLHDRCRQTCKFCDTHCGCGCHEFYQRPDDRPLIEAFHPDDN